MSATVVMFEFETRKELENKILLEKLQGNVKDPNSVRIELDKPIDEIVFDGTRQIVKATVIY